MNNKTLEDLYRQRAHLLAIIAKMATDHRDLRAWAQDSDQGVVNGILTRVIYFQSGPRQMSFHIADRDWGLFRWDSLYGNRRPGDKWNGVKHDDPCAAMLEFVARVGRW